MYFIVKFEDGSVEVVPGSWLLERGTQCYWPQSRGKKLMQDIINNRVPEKSWKKFRVNSVMRKCGENILILILGFFD